MRKPRQPGWNGVRTGATIAESDVRTDVPTDRIDVRTDERIDRIDVISGAPAARSTSNSA
jgi:hypothetical protein